MGALAVVMLSIGALSMFTARSFEVLGNYSAMDRQSSFALDTLGKDIRRAGVVLLCNTNQLVLANLDGTCVTNTWDPATGLVVREFQGITRNLLAGCDRFEFQLFQRNPGNDFTFYPTTDLAKAKLVSVTWQCSRPVYDRHTNTESLQTARFVIRN